MSEETCRQFPEKRRKKKEAGYRNKEEEGWGERWQNGGTRHRRLHLVIKLGVGFDSKLVGWRVKSSGKEEERVAACLC